MNADKKHASRGLGGARRATTMPVDESPQGAASARPAVIVPPDPEVAATPTPTLHGGGQAALPGVGRCLYHGGRPGGAASHRRTLRLEPHDVAPPTHVWCALGFDAPEAMTKGISPASATGGE